MLKSFVRHLTRSARPEPPTDGRGRRLVAVIDCVLNQNVRDAGAACSAGMTWDVVTLCHEFGVGLLQMPCPELVCLGLDRARGPGRSIRRAMESDASRRICATLGAEVVDRIEAHVHAGHQVLAVLGGNMQSPACAVHGAGTGLLPSSGVLMLELQAELRRRGLEIPLRGMRDADAAGQDLGLDDRLAPLDLDDPPCHSSVTSIGVGARKSTFSEPVTKRNAGSVFSPPYAKPGSDR